MANKVTVIGESKNAPLQKAGKLHPSETDILRLLISTQQNMDVEVKVAEARRKTATDNLRDYCNDLVLRRGLNPAQYAVGPDLNWLIKVPQAAIDKAVKDIAQGSQPKPEAVQEPA